MKIGSSTGKKAVFNELLSSPPKFYLAFISHELPIMTIHDLFRNIKTNFSIGKLTDSRTNFIYKAQFFECPKN